MKVLKKQFSYVLDITEKSCLDLDQPISLMQEETPAEQVAIKESVFKPKAKKEI